MIELSSFSASFGDLGGADGKQLRVDVDSINRTYRIINKVRLTTGMHVVDT